MFTEMELHYIYDSMMRDYDACLDAGDDGVVTYINMVDTILTKLDNHFQGRS